MNNFKNNPRRHRFRSNNDRNFKKRNGNGHKLNNDFNNNPEFKRKNPGRNNQNAAKLIEKYNDLAREAQSNGDKILSERQIFLFLCFDILQISLLIGLNGGYTNPFIFIILAPIAIAASYLTIERILIILSLSLVCFALIFNFYIELPLSVRPDININYSLAIMISLFM